MFFPHFFLSEAPPDLHMAKIRNHASGQNTIKKSINAHLCQWDDQTINF